jgi:transcriptional regulator with XRE-family HTH domain
MKQPELGIKINEIRNQNGITQKELADSCNVDIRTIQRIESGEVIPRMSTLKLISETLEIELSTFNGYVPSEQGLYLDKILLLSFISGIIYLVNWGFWTPILPKNEFILRMGINFGIINVITGILYNYGFYELGKQMGNKILQIASIVVMITTALFLITLLLAGSDFVPFIYLNKLVVTLSGLNGIVLGIGLFKAKSKFMGLYKIAALFQILMSPFFIIPVDSLNLIGCWLAIPFLVCINTILFNEFRVSKIENSI